MPSSAAIGQLAIGAVGSNALVLTSKILQDVLSPLINARVLPTPPPQLHHFTSLESAHRIIECDNIRLSHAEYANDQTEMAQAKCRIWAALSARPLHPFFDQVRGDYEKRTPVLDAYIFCMSSTEAADSGSPQDILSQWRAYGQDGRGVCLTLDVGKLNELVYNTPALRINPVTYREAAQDKFVGDILDRGLAAHESNDTNACEATVAALVFVTPLMKARGFEEEREWRLILMPPQINPGPQLGFQARRDFLVPYINLAYLWYELRPRMLKTSALRATLPYDPIPKVSLPLVPISEVMIGPSGHQLLNERAIAKLLSQVNRTEVTIRRSGIPYRSVS